jgi:uncharacterized membrane protein
MKNKTGIIILLFTLVLVAVSIANLFITLNPGDGVVVKPTDMYVGIGFTVVSAAVFVVCLVKVIKDSKAAKEDMETYEDDDDEDDDE